jgi:1,4-dihydroxy-2-naphthoate octaprenyltransferase
MLFIYGLVSKAYSHPRIRIKKYAITGWLITGIFQGLFSFIMCYIGVNKYSFGNVNKTTLIIGGLLTSLMLWANYPMTQVYQHEEDSSRGDKTLSIVLGIRGTFFFTLGFFVLAIAGFLIYLNLYFELKYALYFLLAVLPVGIYFVAWFLQVLKDSAKADYSHTMWLNLISATCLNAFFIYLFLDSSQILQAFQ